MRNAEYAAFIKISYADTIPMTHVKPYSVSLVLQHITL